MNHLVTFCFSIGRIETDILVRSAIGLVRSLDYFNNKYTLYLYTNIDAIDETELAHNPSVKCIHMPITAKRDYNDIWLDLSVYKFTILKRHASVGENPIWIDLDTIVCSNIDHLVNYDNFFIMQGCMDSNPFYLFPNNTDIYVQNKDYIQGNIWKLNNKLVDYFTLVWNEMTIKPLFDIQGMFNYAYHKKGMNTCMNILGRDIDKHTVNGLDIVDTTHLKHPSIDLLKHAIITNDDGVFLQKQTGKTLQFFSFTFLTLCEFLKHNLFSQFEDAKFKHFLQYCKYST
jgi:hypothetical protein